VGKDQVEITLKRLNRNDLKGVSKLFVNRFFNIGHFLHFSNIGTHLEIRKLNESNSGYYFDPSQLKEDGTDEKLFFISGGLGITPNMAILRQLIHENWTKKKSIVFIYSIRTESDFVFKDELNSLRKTHPEVNLIVQKTREGTQFSRINLQFFHDRFNLEVIRASRYFICGPRIFTQEIIETLTQLGAPRSSIKSAGN
jgi:NAD(P)H-flavin reductase